LKLIFDILAYLQGIQDVGVLFPQYFQFWHFLVKPFLSVNGGLWGLPQRACSEKSKLNMI